MVEIEAQYEGGLHTRSVHGPSGAELQTDAPLDNQGRGEAFSPTDLVASALGACMLTVMGIVADRHGWTLAGTRIRVEKHMVTEPLRRIGRLVVELTWAPGIPDSARGPLIRAAETCPVLESLHPEIEVDLKVW
ncbi:MAG: osmotically inducible protein OsmC [bacterium TMED88]|nr:osmotically inducible protein OsmC [Deltaproteobacteria bacterium]OUV34586.1 MAG: osmotically inducible protein OsmC [bacterium TMED88]